MANSRISPSSKGAAMRTDRTAWVPGWLAGLALVGGLLGSAPAAAVTCGGGQTLIDVTLTGNARWEMCWDERPEEGIVLSDVHFTPPGYSTRRVLKQASVGQLHLVYDDDRDRRHIVTEDGLGGASLVDLQSGHCPDGALISNGAIDVMCQSEQGRGYIYKYESSERQGYWLQLFSIARTGDLTWVVRWRFYDDGTIEPSIGSTGTLTEYGTDSSYGSPIASTGQIGVGWVVSTYWRLDFDIGSNGGDDLVERFEVSRTGSDFETKSTAISTITGELAESVDPLLKRSWRVRDLGTTNADGHPVSYHLDPMQTGHRYVPKSTEAWADHDFAVTAYDPCERFASQNPTTGGCGANLADFLANPQNVNGADVVLWYRTTYHYSPRDEDAPYRPIRWQGFIVLPRDWTFESPLSWLPSELPRPWLAFEPAGALVGGRS
jgi:primary-amine oxidase